MDRRTVFGWLAAVVSGYVAVRLTGLVGPVVPWGPVLGWYDQQPEVAQLGVGAAVILFVFFSLVWTAARVAFRLFNGMTKLKAKSGLSSTIVLWGGVLLGAVVVSAVVVPGNTMSMWESDSGPTGTANDLQQEAQSASITGVTDGDVIVPSSLSGGPSRCSRPDGTDSDGDGLPDKWERRGSTPDGAPLPGADPGRKDIYLQVIYEDGAERFSAAEKRQFRRVWDRMPVDNPGGADGIDLHFVDVAPNGGRVDESITVDNSLRSVQAQYYNSETLGSGVCHYYLMAVGTVRGAGGYGAAPGFVSAIDSERYPEWSGSASLRVGIATHELLHNTVGRVNGQTHPNGAGWLSPTLTPDDEYLASVTESDLDEGFAPPW